MKFSIVMPTRNRPALFARALRSVLAQRHAEVEILVVNDGSDDEHRDAYAAVLRDAGPTVRALQLRRAVRGHGQSHAINVGAAAATGGYLGFLDDDDEWADPGYLARVAAMIAASTASPDGAPPDLLFADQAAFSRGERVARTVWIEDLVATLPPGRAPDHLGAYRVSARELLRAHGFCHLNTTIVRRDFFAAIGGMDAYVRYENDREFYLRAIDRAEVMLYRPGIVAHHHVPDAKLQSSLSTSVSVLEKRLFQIGVLESVILFSRRPETRVYARRHKGYVLKSVAQELTRARRFAAARGFAAEALLVAFGAKWLGFCCYLLARSLLQRDARAPAHDMGAPAHDMGAPAQGVARSHATPA